MRRCGSRRGRGKDESAKEEEDAGRGWRRQRQRRQRCRVPGERAAAMAAALNLTHHNDELGLLHNRHKPLPRRRLAGGQDNQVVAVLHTGFGNRFSF